MRIVVLIILSLGCVINAFSQGKYNQMEFPGGSQELTKYFKKEFVEPEEDRNKGLKGMILVSLKVDTTGNITDAKVIKSLSESSTKEALRVIAQMPKWVPSNKNNTTPETIVLVPIRVGE